MLLLVVAKYECPRRTTIIKSRKKKKRKAAILIIQIKGKLCSTSPPSECNLIGEGEEAVRCWPIK